MTSRPSTFTLVVLLAAAPACAGMRPPVQNSGPAVSREGVRLAVTGQHCTQIVEPDEYGNDLVEAVVEVQLHNATAAPLTVHRDAFRLVSPDGIAVRTVTWRAADPLTVEAGQSRSFELRFTTRGSLACAREMTLDADSGVWSRDRSVVVGGIRFVPSPSS